MKTATKLCSFELEKFSKELLSGSQREGVYIHLKDTEGNTSTGEASPLPGRSLETLDDAYSSLIKIKKNFLDNNLFPFSLHPSVMFGMQMAIYSLKTPLLKLKNPTTKLYYSPPLKTSKGKIKLKLGDYGLEDAVNFYESADSKAKGPICIDLERRWDVDKTIKFSKKINPSNLIYIEDPVKNYSDLEYFHKTTNIRFSIDQFLPFQPPVEIKKLRGLHSIIIKPSLIGGLHECLNLQKIFHPIPISLSSLFETSIGINHIRLISSILCPKEYVGVDTLKFFKENDSNLL